MPKKPKEVFEVFDIEYLQYMADSRNIDSTEKSKKQLVTELSSHVSSLGLSVMLRIQKVKDLKVLQEHCEIEDEKLSKATLAKKIQETMEEENPKKFLEKVNDTDLFKNILKAMEVEPPAARREYIDTILQISYEMGLENFISSFPTTKIKEFVKHCKLKVDSDSLDTLLRALVDQESIKYYYPGTTEEPSSKTQPEIDKNITVPQLYNHYFREDLAGWCEKNGLTSHGSKKELVERIRRNFDNTLDQTKDVRHPRKSKDKNDDKTKNENDSDSKKKSTKKRSREDSTKNNKNND